MNNIAGAAPEAWGWNNTFFSAWLARGDSRFVPARVIRREHHLYGVVIPDFSDRLPPGAAGLIGNGGTDGPGSIGSGVGGPGSAAEYKAGSNGGTGNSASGAAPRHSWPLFLDGIRVSGTFAARATLAADFPVVGDWVLVDSLAPNARIQEVLPRTTTLSRAVAGGASEEQVLAANVDTLLLVSGLDGGRNFNLRLLERMLATAWSSGAQPLIILNKVDLASAEAVEDAVRDAESIAFGVPVLAVSAKTGAGMDELSQVLQAGGTVAMLGKSGVGKSALLNALAPKPAARTGEQRGDLQGRHTTTSSVLHLLRTGALLVDSPGIRELRLWTDEEDLAATFPEIADLATGCRFSDCSHSAEPGCAVQAALSSGELPLDRYEAWMELSKEVAWLQRRSDERARAEDRAKWKAISKSMRNLKKPGR